MVLLQSLPTQSPHQSAELNGTAQKFAVLRSQLAKYKLDAYFVPSADEHLNEYLPEAKQRRQWISGFTGSAGDFLISTDKAWVFVDSRYYEQADMQIDANLQKVCKVGLEDHQTVEEVLAELGQQASANSQIVRLGIDPFTITVAQYRRFSERLSSCGVEIVPIIDNLVDAVRSQNPWASNEPVPSFGDQPVIALPDTITGESLTQKLGRVRESMDKKKAAILPVTKLDQIAWLYNLRGRDVECNPVFISYAIVTQNEAYLFTNTARIDEPVRQSLAGQVQILDYEQYIPILRSLVQEQQDAQNVLIAIAQTTYGTYLQLQEVKAKIVEAEHPVEMFKSHKNAVEIAQMQQANLKASWAKTLTLKWIEEQIDAGHSISERDVANKIEGLYRQQEGFYDLSFPTIAGTGANGSIVHYSNPNPACQLLNGDLLLLDSGAQFYGGTTDDTRSISLGTPTEEQRNFYTEVLKSHINCAMQRFPKGTTGSQIDGIARSSMWQSGLDFGHGTGHGVGVFLNVHEGPNGISKRVNQSLDLGTINSIEPGYYKPKWGGIRLENLYFVKAAKKQDSESSQESDTDATLWYEFESLTYIPFDKKLIDRHKLNSQQIAWLENYYAAVVQKLSPMLSDAETAWLKQACSI
ncbi:M24 family metallopeptidase [Pseudanabaena mucicola]|uniref:Aminopeptidase P family N-terminal domain-containing protein n=1 Tax=Pseudanabaena mucicola FACHB-723 TaxID=2692860 RepID=A0ABR7ZU16_9CYAN|nr:M24 family metallopeptidase [Pseudanabaena mucicola]MBD2187017.1 aminopeptidase P family N-terminal domain-containing protein [Pseudanabaena mucicola FACHB-723]